MIIQFYSHIYTVSAHTLMYPILSYLHHCNSSCIMNHSYSTTWLLSSEEKVAPSLWHHWLESCDVHLIIKLAVVPSDFHWMSQHIFHIRIHSVIHSMHDKMGYRASVLFFYSFSSFGRKSVTLYVNDSCSSSSMNNVTGVSSTNDTKVWKITSVFFCFLLQFSAIAICIGSYILLCIDNPPLMHVLPVSSVQETRIMLIWTDRRTSQAEPLLKQVPQ